MEYKNIIFDLKDNVASITLNRPDAFNTFNREMSLDLMNAAIYCSEDPVVRAVVITGAGGAFSAGGDLKEFLAQGERLATHFKETTTYLHAAVSYLAHLEAPVVAAVSGAAAGAGLSLACACDLVIAGESSRFTMAYTRVGLTPDGSGTYFLPRIVGLKRALELALTNRVLSAKDALDWGIVTRVVPDGEVLAQARSLAAQLAAGATKALGTAKRLLLTSWGETLETQMEHESQGIASMAHTEDGRNGIAGFVEKRPVKFIGK